MTLQTLYGNVFFSLRMLQKRFLRNKQAKNEYAAASFTKHSAPRETNENSSPPKTGQVEHCLLTAISVCYSNPDKGDLIMERVRDTLGVSWIGSWNNHQTLLTVLELADKLDI